MEEIRFHGRGGQGAVVASNILGDAAFREGKFVQSFPFFGVERRGAPVTAFLRIDDKKINIRSQVYNPDYAVVMDPTLLRYFDILEDIKDSGIILINTQKNKEGLKFKVNKKAKLYTINATDIALGFNLGSKTAPIVNTSMLGAFIKIAKIVTLDSLLESIQENINVKKTENINAAKKAYENIEI